jgi:FkbM family methyltransferase
MLFVLHFLRPGDLFVDVGANVGVYSVLASAVAGAKTIAVEPIPQTFSDLLDNIRLNRIEESVVAANVGLGRHEGTLRFTAGLGCMNRALAAEEAQQGSVAVPITTLDLVVRGAVPVLIKIDVEGLETEVLDGADSLLRDVGLLAIVIELNGAGRRYGYRDQDIDERLRRAGFLPCEYEPLTRRLERLSVPNSKGNTLYLRDLDDAQRRLVGSRPYAVAGRSL